MTMATCHDGIANVLTATESTTGGACILPELLLTSGTDSDTAGVAHSSYPLTFGDHLMWPAPHHHHHYPWSPYPAVTTELHTHVTAPAAEKPHEVVQRALKEIAGATRALRDSAEAMGVPVDAGVLEEAIVRKLHEALAR